MYDFDGVDFEGACFAAEDLIGVEGLTDFVDVIDRVRKEGSDTLVEDFTARCFEATNHFHEMCEVVAENARDQLNETAARAWLAGDITVAMFDSMANMYLRSCGLKPVQKKTA